MIRIEVKNESVHRALARLAAELANPAGALAEIGETLAASTKQRFDAAKDPDGAPWAPLAPATVARKGHERPLIGETGALSAEIVYAVAGNRLEVGSPLEYAATHQFGAKKGAFGRTRRGAPIPWGDIPARPFLGISREDAADIDAIVREHIEAALK